MKGVRVDRMKDRDGNRLTDAHLAKKLGETVSWVPEVYSDLCSFGPFFQPPHLHPNSYDQR
jgi:hypothetical protein